MLNNPSKKVAPPKHTQLTFEGNIYFYENWGWFNISQISPDGQFTAYVAGEGNEKSIYLKDNSGEQAIEIFKGIDYIFSLKWSPDGNEIFFSARMDTSWASYIIPKLGGKVQELKYIGSGCWSPNGNLIAGFRSSMKSIRLIKLETDEIVKTVELSGSFTWLQDLDWSPNGDKIVFSTYDDKTGSDAIWLIDTNGAQQQKIVEATKRIYSPRWSLDGEHIYYLQANEMTRDLMKIEVSSNTSYKIPKVVQTGLQAYGFSITSDNKKLCYTKDNSSSNLWSFTYNERTNLFQSKKLTKGTSLFATPVISPDFNEIAFVYNYNISKMYVNGNSIKQVTFLNSECRSPSWRPNGEEIAFISGLNLAKVSSEGGAPTIFKNTNTGGQTFWGSESEIFYHKPGNRNFYIFNPVTKESRLLVSNDSVGWMFNPHLSPDGLKIAIWWNRFPKEVKTGLWIISRKDSSQKLLVKGVVYPLRWSTDGKWIYAIDTGKTPLEILMISANDGLTKVIYTLPPSKTTGDYDIDITPDGKTIICAVPETNSDVWMIENFDPDVE